MDEVKRRLVTAWLEKAREDLSVVIIEENRLYAAEAYHCQQAAEKALKACLTCHDMAFPKTHDLEALLHLCRSFEPGFAAYGDHARALTPLATEYRYPGDSVSPSRELARMAMSQAEEVLGYAAKHAESRLNSG